MNDGDDEEEEEPISQASRKRTRAVAATTPPRSPKTKGRATKATKTSKDAAASAPAPAEAPASKPTAAAEEDSVALSITPERLRTFTVALSNFASTTRVQSAHIDVVVDEVNQRITEKVTPYDQNEVRAALLGLDREEKVIFQADSVYFNQ
jgi:hypothetical protein